MFCFFIFHIKVTKNLVEREAKENRIKDSGWLKQTEAEGSLNVIIIYLMYLNKRRGAYKNFYATNAALIRWRRLFES